MAIDNKILNQIPVTAAENANEVEDVISSKLPFVVKWGAVIFLILLILPSGICWFIKYPETVLLPAKIQSLNDPIEITSVVNGNLLMLKVKENDDVELGSIIGFIESTAKHAEILTIDSCVNVVLSSSCNFEENIRKIFNNRYSNLGELQQPYLVFYQKYISTKEYFLNNIYNQKRDILSKELEVLQKKILSISDQKEIGVLNDIHCKKYKKMTELENRCIQSKVAFRQALNTFKNQLDVWKKKFILIAPQRGKVFFANCIRENQKIRVGQTLCYIKPEPAVYIAHVFLPEVKYEKIELGQPVMLKLHAYPFQQYGSLRGQIYSISYSVADSGYVAKVKLIDGLVTTYNQRIQYTDGAIVNAEIFTKEVRLLQKFYQDFMYQVCN